MPNYDYFCESCRNEFTEQVTIANRDAPRACPECNKKECKRAVSVVKLSYSGFKSNLSRTSNGWNDVLKKVKGGSGRGNSINTK